jgi:hypothetical protein
MRKITNTVEYFPHFVQPGKTLFILKSRFRNDGYAFWFQLLELLCNTENHYYDCRDENSWQYLLAQTGVNEITGTEILNLLSSIGKIDPELWKLRVIWCENLVKNLDDVYKKRKRELPTRPNIVDNKTITGTEKGISAPEKGISVPECVPPQNTHECTLYAPPKSKVKDSKGEGSEETRISATEIDSRKKYGEFKNVYLSSDEYDKLVKRLGLERAKDLIERLGAYMKSRRKKYDSHYATLLNWARDDDSKVTKKGANDATDKKRPRQLVPRDGYTTPEQYRSGE